MTFGTPTKTTFYFNVFLLMVMIFFNWKKIVLHVINGTWLAISCLILCQSCSFSWGNIREREQRGEMWSWWGWFHFTSC